VCPSIGDRVFIGAGAIIIGAVDVGDDAVIGAGAVVTKSVPPRGVVVGNPARVIAMTGSFDLIHYRGMETDTKRAESHRAILVDQQMATSFATSELLPRKRVP
jgi:serine acetyltransferase